MSIDSATALLRLKAAAHEAARHDRHTLAADTFERAITLLSGGVPVPAALAVPPWLMASLHLGAAEARFESHDMGSAERWILSAQGLLDAEPAAAPAVLRAGIALCRAKLQAVRGRPDDALQTVSEALRLLAGARDASEAPLPLHVRCLSVHAAACAMTHRLEDALSSSRSALGLLDRWQGQALSRERSRVLMNLANVEHELGQIESARAHFMQALATARGIVDAGAAPMRFDIALICMNLGSMQTTTESFAEAIRMQRRAVALLRREQRMQTRAGRAADRPAMVLPLALMNLGYTLYQDDRLAQALQVLTRADAELEGLAAGSARSAFDRHKTQVNLGHVLLRLGRAAEARNSYRAGIAGFVRLVDRGLRHHRYELANAQLGLARALAAGGRLLASVRWARRALGELAGLTFEGQIELSRAWWRGLDGVMVVLREAAPGRRAFGDRRDAAWACLRAALDKPPARNPPGAELHLRDLEQALQRLQAWRLPTPAVDGTRGEADCRRAWTALLCTWAGDLFSESEPAWIAVHEAELERLRHALFERAWMQDDPRLVLHWFLNVHGLRAQRDALAQSADARVEALAHQRRELRTLEAEMFALAAPGPRAGPAAADPALAARPAGQARLQQGARQWLDLHQRCEQLTAQLIAQGVLPPLFRLGAEQLRGRLQPGQAALLLARRSAAELVAIWVVPAGRPDDPLVARISLIALPHEVQAFDCQRWLNVVRRSLAGGRQTGPLRRGADLAAAEDPEALAFDTMAAQLAAGRLKAIVDALAAALAPLQAIDAVEQIVVVPSEDLHVLPWGLLREAVGPGGRRLTLYPSVGAWWQHGQQKAPEPGRWAIAAWPASGTEAALPWVEVEQRGAARLWQAACAEPVLLSAGTPAAEGVDALLCIGHGAATDSKLAGSGLLLGAGHVLTAHALPAIRHCRRLIASCCVLGQTREVAGEPLGFLAAAFGYETSFAAGWLTEVPDEMACLFSLAFQYALVRAGGELGWSETFETVRSAIGEGRWPEGFGSWLANHQTPTEAAQSGRPWPADGLGAPPPALRELMPWVVCLGR